MKTDVDNRLIWLNKKLVNVNDAKINVLSPTAQFGLNVFEGIRGYWNEKDNQLYVFRLGDHLNRLERSLELMEIDPPYTRKEMTDALFSVIRANGYEEDIAVRQTVFVEGFGSWGSSSPSGMFISPIPKAKSSAEYNKKGLNCCISSWRRISDEVLSPRIKCGANYINSRMAQREALRNGYDTTIFLNQAGTLAEGPGSCLFIVRDGVISTPSLTDSVLESITRDTLIRLASDMGFEVVERSIDRTELYIADEAFLCGSAMEITPICSIDRHEIHGGTEGVVTRELHKRYLDVVTHADDRYPAWTTPVY